MIDLGTQLRDYLDATAPPVVLEEIFAAPVGDDPVRPLQPRRSRRNVRGWGYAAVAAVIIGLLVGGVAWLTRSQDGVEPADEPITTTVVTETTTRSSTAPLEWAPVDSGAPVFGTGEEAADSGLLNVPAPVYEIQSDQEGNLTISGQTVDSTYQYSSPDANEWQEAMVLPDGFDHFEPFRSMDGKQVTIAQYAGREGFAVVVSGDGQTWTRYPITNRRSTSARAAFDYNNCGNEPAVMGETVIYVECNYSWDHLYDMGVLTGSKRPVCEVGLDGAVLTAWHCEGEGEPNFQVTVDLETLDLLAAQKEAVLRPISLLTVGVALNGEIEVDPTETPIRGSISHITVSGGRFVMTASDELADYFGIASGEAAVYTSTDGQEWSEIDVPAGSVNLQIDSNVIFAIVDDQTGSGTSLWTSSDGSGWTELAEFDDHDVYFVDSGASGFVITTQPGDRISGLPEPEIGWSADAKSWAWQSLSEALGGETGDWAWARATMGDGFLVVLAQRSIKSLGYDTMEGNETELIPLLVPQWFMAEFG